MHSGADWTKVRFWIGITLVMLAFWIFAAMGFIEFLKAVGRQLGGIR